MQKEYERVREEFEIVARIGSKADIKSAMLNVDALVEAVREEAKFVHRLEEQSSDLFRFGIDAH